MTYDYLSNKYTKVDGQAARQMSEWDELGIRCHELGDVPVPLMSGMNRQSAMLPRSAFLTSYCICLFF